MRGGNHAISATLHVTFITLICAFTHEVPPETGRETQMNEIEIKFIVSKPSSSSSSSFTTENKQNKSPHLAQNKKLPTQTIKSERTITQPSENIENIRNNEQASRESKVSNNTTNIKSSFTSESTNNSKEETLNNSQMATHSNVKPACKRCIKPSYPRTALRKSQEGYVLVQLTVNTSGRVTGVSVIKSSGITSIDNAALTAAKKSTFMKQSRSTRFTIAYDLRISK